MRNWQHGPGFGVWLAFIVCFGGCQPAAGREKDIALLARAATSHDQREADRAACRAIVDKAKASDMPAVDRTVVGSPGGEAGAPGVAGAAIVSLIFLMIENGRAADRGVTLCMINRGYAPLPLTLAEAAQYRALAPERRAAWEREFLDQDLGARLAAVTAPKVPPLPEYREAPQTIGGLRFDVAGFQVSPAPAKVGEALLTGTVSRWRTAVLTGDFASSKGPVTISGTAGAVFHQVDYRPQREPALREPEPTWCGPVEQRSGASAAPSVYCLSSGRDGYELFRPTGFAWLAGPPGDGFALPMLTEPVLLNEREADDLGPLDFAIAVEAVQPTAVTLAATVSRKGQKVRIWQRRLKPGRDGRIIVPLWEKQLVLTVDAQLAVTAALAPGDGTSLRDAP